MRQTLLRTVLLAAAGLLPAAQNGVGSPLPKIDFEKYTLPNGLQVILHVDRKLPVVHVNEWFHVGSMNERVGRTGFAHLFEHMMFQGSQNAGKYIPEAELIGASVFTGGVNGTTNWDRTNYFATVPSGNLEMLLWLESDRLATLPDALTKEKLDNQRGVVKNERRQGLENQPYGRAFKLMFENLYPYRHPYANDVLGSHEDLTAASADDVKDFFKTYYTPNNLSLVIAGDFDPAQAKKLVAKYFGPVPPGPALERPVKWQPKLEGERLIEVSDRVPQERVYNAWATPAFFDPGDAELDLSGTILADGLSSRLQKRLIYDEQLCSDAVAFQFSRELGGTFILWATARPGAKLSDIQRDIDAEIARLATEGPTAAELNRAKAKWEYNYITGLERIGGFGGKADLLNQYNVYLADPNKFEADLSRHRNVSPDGIKKSVSMWLNTPDRLVVRFHPETSTRPSEVTIDRTKRPGLGEDRPFHPPAVQTSTLSNGLEILVIERHELPKVAVTFQTRAGAVSDPAGKDGVADLLASTIKRGTTTRKSLEIEDALGDLGTSIGGGAGREDSGLGVEVLKQNLRPAFAILADVVRNPAFPAEEFVREKKLRLDDLSQQAQDPSAMGDRLANMVAFGPDHPYGRSRQGLPSTVSTLTRDDLVKFHASYWKPGSSALVFAGDITLAEAKGLAEAEFGSWQGGAAAEVAIPAPKPLGPSKTYVFDRQDAAQTYVVQVMPAPRRASPDYYPLRLADSVYGGAFNTRLNMNLREQKGYSYGIFSFTGLYDKWGIWRANGGVQTDKTKESVAEFRKELSDLSGGRPITEKELADARAQRIRAYAQQFESLGQIAQQVGTLWAHKLPMSELEREPSELAKVSLETVNATAKKYAAPSPASLVLVGDWSKIGPGLRSLDLGEIVIIDEAGKTHKPD